MSEIIDNRGSKASVKEGKQRNEGMDEWKNSCWRLTMYQKRLVVNFRLKKEKKKRKGKKVEEKKKERRFALLESSDCRLNRGSARCSSHTPSLPGVWVGGAAQQVKTASSIRSTGEPSWIWGTLVHTPLKVCIRELRMLGRNATNCMVGKDQKYIVLEFWRLEIQNHGVSKAVPSLMALEKNLSLPLLPSRFASNPWHSWAGGTTPATRPSPPCVSAHPLLSVHVRHRTAGSL